MHPYINSTAGYRNHILIYSRIKHSSKMFKAIVVAAILALAVAAPEPKPKPGLVAAYSAPLVGAPIAYTAGYAAPYAAAPVVSTYHGAAYTAPYAYSAYSAYSAPVVYA